MTKSHNQRHPKRPKMLSALFVKKVAEPGRYGDGRGGYGLSLLVKPRVGGGVVKSWSQRIRIDGKPTYMGLGGYPLVTLAKARELALQNRRTIFDGGDPRRKAAETPNFDQAAEAAIRVLEKHWQPQEGQAWRSMLRRYVSPALGSRPIDKISPADVVDLLLPLSDNLPPTARRLRQRLSAIMKWAIARGYRIDNPAGSAISRALPRGGVRSHYRALPHGEVAGALAKVRASGAYVGAKLCLEFLVLTATRSGEARGALWNEINREQAVWVIPAERMKAGRPHRVPLSDRALEVLDEAWKIRRGCGRVFPSSRGLLMTGGILGTLLRANAIEGVPHGFRASFRTWAEEMTDTPRAVMEAALAHRLGDLVEQAYARSDLFDKRRTLMTEWANYVSQPPGTGQEIPDR